MGCSCGTSKELSANGEQCTVIIIDHEEYEARYGRQKPVVMFPIRGQSDVTLTRHLVDEYLKERLSLWKDPSRARILLALTEAVTNVVKHTPGGALSVYIDAVGPRFHVIDRGKGLHPDCPMCKFFRKGFSTTASLGAGFFVMMQYFREIVLCTSSRGTKLVLCSDLKSG